MPPLESNKDRQFTQLLRDLTETVETRFSETDEATKTKFREFAAEIERMDERVESAESAGRKRFHQLATHYQRGGDYKGAFADVETAKQFGALCVAMGNGDLKAKLAASNNAAASFGITGATGEAGGILMGESLIGGILRHVEQAGIIEQNANVLEVPTQSGKRTKRKTGATVYYPDWNSGPAESTLKFAAHNFQCARYSALALIDRWMLSETMLLALADYVAEELGYALHVAMDTNAFVGDGSPTYAKTLGLFNNTDVGSVVGGAGDDTYAEMIDKTVYYLGQMLGAIPDYAGIDDRLAFYGNRSIYFRYLSVLDSNGKPIADFLSRDGKPQRLLMGYPFRSVPSAAKLSDAVQADKTVLTLASLYDAVEVYRFKGGIELRVSEHYQFVEGNVAYIMDVPQTISVIEPTMAVNLKTHA